MGAKEESHPSVSPGQDLTTAAAAAGQHWKSQQHRKRRFGLDRKLDIDINKIKKIFVGIERETSVEGILDKNKGDDTQSHKCCSSFLDTYTNNIYQLYK